MNTSVIRNAIANRQVIEFSYHGYQRIAEIHVYGIIDGKRQVLVYQVGGLTSSGKIPDWRLISIDDLKNFKATNQNFSPREKPSYKWETVISEVV